MYITVANFTRLYKQSTKIRNHIAKHSPHICKNAIINVLVDGGGGADMYLTVCVCRVSNFKAKPILASFISTQ